ncbi:MAG: thioredoxin family protein [Nostocaceae cyanobacterium]|nr:thioredoxin family protein [Nostocaceae cyanobacterium]
MNILEIIDTTIGSYAPDFELPGIDQQVHHLSRYLDKFQGVGVIFMCNRCPYVKLYLNRLKNIQLEFASMDFTLIGINGNNFQLKSMESLANMKAFAGEHALNFPYLWDSTQDVTRSFGARKIPMAFLIDRNGVIRYKGQIDDRPHNPNSVSKYYFKNAISSMLRGDKIQLQETETVGTSLIWRN